MTEKYRNKYRVPSSRLKNWDYGSNAMYFVTICTQHRECYFGDIVETPKLGVSTYPDKIKLSEIGRMAENYWHEIPQHFPFVQLGSFVVMPNHVHGIIIIDKPVETPKLGVSTTTTTAQKWQSATLGVIINQYKRIVTINARKIHQDFSWQPRFHDHIIRNDESLQRISNYILNNPSKWTEDKLFNNKQPKQDSSSH